MADLSIGELDSLIMKAFRGAGFSWGLAQEAGRAAAWMAMQQLPAAECFASLLRHTDGNAATQLFPKLDDGICLASNSPRCPVLTGSVISDIGWVVGSEGGIGKAGQAKIGPGDVYSPLILLPFVAHCAKSASVVLCVRFDNIDHLIGSDGRYLISEATFSTAPCASVEITEGSVDISSKEEPPQARRASVSDTDLPYLESLAFRTYVPASEASRKGAGAGLTDND